MRGSYERVDNYHNSGYLDAGLLEYVRLVVGGVVSDDR